jgi:hypothetical protein
VRVQIDNVAIGAKKELVPGPQPSSSPLLLTTAYASLQDTFVVYYCAPISLSSPGASVGTLQPIMIFDPNLAVHPDPTPNSSSLMLFPSVDLVSEWEREGAAHKPSIWRARARFPQNQQKKASGNAAMGAAVGPEAQARSKAIEFTFRSLTDPAPSPVTELSILPIHFFLSLEVISVFVVPFLDRTSPHPPTSPILSGSDLDIEPGDEDARHHLDHRIVENVGWGAPRSFETEKVMDTPRPHTLELGPEPNTRQTQDTAPRVPSVGSCRVHCCII